MMGWDLPVYILTLTVPTMLQYGSCCGFLVHASLSPQPHPLNQSIVLSSSFYFLCSHVEARIPVIVDKT